MMRAILLVTLVVFGCSKKQEKAAPRIHDAAVVIDAAPPPPTEIGGIPVAFALPSDYSVYQEIAMDAERVYVIASDVLAFPRSGGAPKVLVDISIDEATGTSLVKPSNEEDLRRMTADRPEVAAAMRGVRSYEYAKNYSDAAVHGEHLYLANRGTDARKLADATIERVAVGGGAVEVLAKELPDGIDEMFVDDSGIYLVTHKSEILKLPLVGGAVTTLYPAPVSADEARYEVAFGGDSFFVSESTLDKDFAHKNGTITRVPKAGGAPKVVVTKLPASVSEMIADASAVYWVDGKYTGVYRIDHAGKQKPKLVGKGRSEALHVHGKHLYRITQDQLVRAPITGGVEEKLRALPDHTGVLAVEDSAVWLSKDGYILRHALP